MKKKLVVPADFTAELRKDLLILIDNYGKIKFDCFHPFAQWNVARSVLWSLEEEGLIKQSLAFWSNDSKYRLTPVGQKIVDEIKYERAKKSVT